jgi:hypothetical protein
LVAVERRLLVAFTVIPVLTPFLIPQLLAHTQDVLLLLVVVTVVVVNK